MMPGLLAEDINSMVSVLGCQADALDDLRSTTRVEGSRIIRIEHRSIIATPRCSTFRKVDVFRCAALSVALQDTVTAALAILIADWSNEIQSCVSTLLLY